MDMDKRADLTLQADVTAPGTGKPLRIALHNHYLLEGYDPDGVKIGEWHIDNEVPTGGLNDSLDKHLKGSAYTATWYVFLTDGTPTTAPTDTMASHAGWVEVTNYTEGTRPALVLGTVAAGSVDNSASKAVFSINQDATTIGGAGVVFESTKGGTTGPLYGVGAIAGGDIVLNNGSTLNMTVTATAVTA